MGVLVLEGLHLPGPLAPWWQGDGPPPAGEGLYHWLAWGMCELGCGHSDRGLLTLNHLSFLPRSVCFLSGVRGKDGKELLLRSYVMPGKATLMPEATCSGVAIIIPLHRGAG